MESGTGKVEKIWIKSARKGPMVPVTLAYGIAQTGLEGNANRGGNRQVTVIELEAFQKVEKELGRPVSPVWRRANVMVSGIQLKDSLNRILRLGNLRLHIKGETHPCDRMDQACPGLQKALEPDWRGGVYGVVLNDGLIGVGDSVDWES